MIDGDETGRAPINRGGGGEVQGRWDKGVADVRLCVDAVGSSLAPAQLPPLSHAQYCNTPKSSPPQIESVLTGPSVVKCYH